MQSDRLCRNAVITMLKVEIIPVPLRKITAMKIVVTVSICLADFKSEPEITVKKLLNKN